MGISAAGIIVSEEIVVERSALSAQSNLKPSRRMVAILAALASFSFATAWGAYLFYWAFADDVSPLIVVLIVASVPPMASAVGLLGAALVGDLARFLRWLSASVLVLSIVSPGLMGGGYLPAAILMIVAALIAGERKDSRRGSP